MFDKDVRIQGIYATHLKSLARDMVNSKKPYLFDRYIDVYMNAAIIGLLEGKPEMHPDYSTTKDTAQIFAAAFLTERYKCEFLYRLVMLLDDSTSLTNEQKIDRAFKDDGNVDKCPEKMVVNEKLFLGYVLAGIEILYEKIGEGATSVDDLCLNAYAMMENYQDKWNNLTPEECLKKALRSN